MGDFSLNTNTIGGSVKVVTEAPRKEGDEDIYDLRRQIEARQVVKDYLRTEILRIQQLMEEMTRDIVSLDLKLGNRKPKGEPNNKRALYAPGSEHTLKEDEKAIVETNIVE